MVLFGHNMSDHVFLNVVIFSKQEIEIINVTHVNVPHEYVSQSLVDSTWTVIK